MLLAVALCTLNIVLETTAAGAQNSYSPPELLHGVENLEALLRKPLASGSSEDCQSRSDGLPRDIVGGRVVSPPWRYPYVVHLVSYYGYSAGCSGALIARDVVVTARHCIGNPPITNVWIGRWDLYDQKEVYQSLFVVDVAEYSTSSDKYVHDIALLKLSGDAWHRPVAMDGEKSDDLANHVEYNDLRVTSMGWVRTLPVVVDSFP